MGHIQTNVLPFTPRSGGPDTAQQAGKGVAGGKVPDSGLTPGGGFPLAHNLLDEPDAEVGGLLCLMVPFQTEMLFTGPDSSSGSNATIKHAKYVNKSNQIT